MAQLLLATAKFLTPIIGGGAAGAFVGFLARFGPLLLLNVLSSKLFGPKIPNSLKTLQGHSVMTRSAVAYRQIVYGQAAVSGPIIYNNTEGINRENLWYVIALCDGEIEDYVSVWLDGDEIPKADISWSAGVGGADGSGTGAVSTNAFHGDGSPFAVAANLFYTLGHPDQVALGPVDTAFGEWDSNDRARGVALLAAKLVYTEETEKVWQKGAPSNIKAIVKGRKIYDPRLDSTQIIDDTTSPLTYGAGLHRTADSTTWQWSENPALCIADYLVNYMGVATTAIDWPSIAAAADDCDVTVVIGTASPEPTEKRFTCNGVLSMGASHKDNLDNILSSCDGKLSYTEGKWKMRASVWEAASVSFDEDDMAGPVQVRGSAPKAERFNSVRGVFVDPDRFYEPVEFPHITNSTYLTRDNSVEIMYDLELPMTNSRYMAQRIAFRLLEQADNQIVARFTANARGAKCAIGDVISLTVAKLSWSSKTFRVIEWQRNANGTFVITAREDESASYSDPAAVDYLDRDSADITIPTEVVPPPTNFSASSVPYAIRLNWTNPAFNEFDIIDIYVSDTSAWSGATLLASVRADTYTHNIGSGTVKYYWLRARRNNGDVSLRVPNSDTSTVTATAGAGTDSVNITGATLSDEQEASTTEVGYRLTSGGAEESYEGVPPSPTVWDSISTWLLDGSAGDYYVELTKTSGTDPTSGPALATRHQLSTTRTWIWTDSTQNDVAVTFEGTVTLYDSASPQAVLGTANLSVTIDSQTPSIGLSGTSGSPNSVIDTQASPTDAISGWSFNADGTVDEIDTTVTGTKRYTQFNASTEWAPSLPSPNIYYVRATSDSGDNPTGGTLGVWYALTSDIEWTWTVTGTGTLDGTLKIEIATDASPHSSDIVATGYYRGRSFVSL